MKEIKEDPSNIDKLFSSGESKSAAGLLISFGRTDTYN
jgi:hypothetical protein